MNQIATSSVPLDQLGRSLRDLRISLTDQCNLRCGYCMPAEVFHSGYPFLKNSEQLSFEEILRVVKVFVSCGGKKVRLTGGEPLLRKDIPELVGSLKEIEGLEEVALTTNGLLLPKYAEELAEVGLDRITLSLDALNDATFQKMSGRGVGVDRVLEGMSCAAEVGLPVKVNAVIIKGMNEEEVLPLAEFFRGRSEILRFIEFMDVGNCNGWSSEQVYSAKEILADIESRYALEAVEPNYIGEVARRYKYCDGAGEVGIIASVTLPFCRACNRARLSADGKLFTCLFASNGLDLRSVLRGGGDLEATLRRAWGAREDRYSEIRGNVKEEKIEMSYIGG